MNVLIDVNSAVGYSIDILIWSAVLAGLAALSWCLVIIYICNTKLDILKVTAVLFVLMNVSWVMAS